MSAWEIVMQEGNGNREEVNFIKLPVGNTKLRIVDTEPKVMYKHWIQKANSGKGLSVICPGQGVCPICQEIKADKAKGAKPNYSVNIAFAINAIQVNAEGEITYCVLEKGKGVFQPLNVLRSQMGDLINYEVNITRTGEKMQDVNYTVLPVFPPVELDEETLKEVNENKYDMNKVYTTYSREEIIKLMNGENIFENVSDSVEEETPVVPPQGNIFTT